MTALIFLDPRLHTPMYFLLSQLSLMDLMYISSTVPKMVYNFLSGQKSISFLSCGVQSFFFATMASSEGLLLASMAYDRFVAICHPLHYHIYMSKRMCVKMFLGSWTLGSLNGLVHTVYALHLPYCRSRTISHFDCDIPAMLLLNVRSPEEDKNLAVFYTILTPMLNPIIYSLRNKKVLGAMRRVCGMFSSRKK
ncbi:olfactory receptor 2L13-like [Marmota flaviventris]|uniref:olfactory receptor 2L13-like n=1 Tax=Marmota flaviventris TaxID=93162 RepID=UPI003A88AE05